jgi:hypothetical protein
MDQDMPHRISSPSRIAPGPRYSLVWKLVLWPKGGGGGGGGGGAAAGASVDGSVAGAAAGVPVVPEAAGELDGWVERGFKPAVSGLARPEWGPPQRVGSAAAAAGGGRRALWVPGGSHSPHEV